MGKLTFQIEAGVLIRRYTRRMLKVTAANCGVDLIIEEDKGFFDSLFLCKATGDRGSLVKFEAYVTVYMREIG